MIDNWPPARAPDYFDRFSGPVADANFTARELLEQSLQSTPRWFLVIFALRQKLAQLVGLKTGPKPGDHSLRNLSRMPVIFETDDRLESGMQDKHLDFTLTIERNETSVVVTTNIWFNCASGRAYLFVIKPFHRLILRNYIANMGHGI